MKELANIETLPVEAFREQVMDGLVERFSQESLGLEDFERRTILVTKAANKAEILSAIVDLPDVVGKQLPVAKSGATGWRVSTESVKETEHAICIFGGSDRKGIWRAPRKLQTLCVFGGANIDLRRAVVPPEGLTIHVMAVFGGVDVTVPPDMRLEVRGIGIFGGFDHRETPDAPDSAPLVRIEGLAVFGGVGVRVRS